MTILIIAIVVLAFGSIPCWLALRQAQANHVVIKDVKWAVNDLKTLLIEREHEAGYVSGTSDERRVGAERAADLAAVAVTVAAEAALAAKSSDIYDPDDNLVAHIKPTDAGRGSRPDAA